MSMVAEATPTPRRSTRVYRRPTWWTVRPLDGARYEVALFHQGCPLNWHVVTLDPCGAVSCTCPSGREGFRRTQRGWCQHVEALMRAALRAYRPLTLDAERLTYCPPCHGCRPLCRSLIVEWSAAL
jgi:hypothetical protein